MNIHSNNITHVSKQIDKIISITFTNNKWDEKAIDFNISELLNEQKTQFLQLENKTDISQNGNIHSLQEICARKVLDIHGTKGVTKLPLNLQEKYFLRSTKCDLCEKFYFNEFFGHKKKTFLNDKQVGSSEIVLKYKVCSRKCESII